VELSEPLKPKKIYYTEVWVRVSSFYQYTCNNVGLYFSDTLVKDNTINILPFKPQVNYASVISDTTQWVCLRGSFKATSKSKYLIIGNFYTNQETTYERIRIAEPDFTAVFYDIDDVYVGLTPRKEDNYE
jgi:hypothetical protein